MVEFDELTFLSENSVLRKRVKVRDLNSCLSSATTNFKIYKSP